MFGLIGAALSGAGLIGNIFGRGKANRQLEELLKSNPTYTADPLAKTLLNARMPGAAQLENNIYNNQANTIAGFERNATDPSQVLALAAGAQGQTNDAFNDLSLKEAMDYQRRYGNYISEQDKAFQDKVRRFQDTAAIRGAQAQNRAATWNSITGLGNSFLSAGIGMEKNPFGLDFTRLN